MYIYLAHKHTQIHPGVEGGGQRSHSVRFTQLFFHIFRLSCIFKDTLPCLTVTKQMKWDSGSLTTEPSQAPRTHKARDSLLRYTD